MFSKFSIRINRGRAVLFFALSVVIVVLISCYVNYKRLYIKEKPAVRDSSLESLTNDEPTKELCADSREIEYFSYADEGPIWEKNNKIGIYIYAEESDFFKRADELVNTNGGNWGYVLIPYNVKDQSFEKWNEVFLRLRERHLIPIIQLWDVDTEHYKEQTQKAASFLNRFLWPIKYRYISVYNEPNDKRFWYGDVDPAEYAEILDYTIEVFKQENDDFFMLNGGLNASAPNDGDHMDSLEYMRQMEVAVPGIFSKLDGWASHSYPQPNFSGSPYDIGRWSIKAYEIELDYLKKVLKVEKELPVFITETGWAHAEGKNYNSSYYTVDTVSEFVTQALEDVWLKDERVRAVTFFTIRYDPPYDHFSWLNEDNVPYKHFDTVKNMKKIGGEPPVLVSNKIMVGGCSK